MKHWHCIAILIALTLAVFGQSVTFDFIEFDDSLYVTENLDVQRGVSLNGIRYAFSPDAAPITNPLALVSLMVDVEFFGVSPGWHHASNVMFHVLATLLLYAFCDQALGRRGVAFFVAAVFAIHPLHVESVAWISSRKDPLSAVFFFLALIAYHRYVETRSIRNMAIVTVWYLMSLLSKPTTITFPFVLLLMDGWPYDRPGARLESLKDSARLLIEKIPLFVLTFAGCLATWYVQQLGGAVRVLDDYSIGERAANAIIAYGIYVRQFFVPIDLALYYSHPGPNFSPLALAGSSAMILTVSALSVAWYRKFPYVFLGWFWFLGMLVPVIGLVQVGSQSHADRYMYLPAIGLTLIIASGFSHYFEMRGLHKKAPFAHIAAALVVIALALVAYRQCRLWRDTETLFLHTFEVDDHYFLKPNMGIYYAKQGRNDEAYDYMLEAFHADPTNAVTVYNVGWLEKRLGNIEESMRLFELSVEAKTDFSRAYESLVTSHFESEDYAMSLRWADRAIQANAATAKIMMYRGMSNEKLGNLDDALEDLERACSMNRSDPRMPMNHGNVLARAGRFRDAISEYNLALTMDSDHAQTLYNRGAAFERMGNIAEALASYRRAANADPGAMIVREQIQRLEARH